MPSKERQAREKTHVQSFTVNHAPKKSSLSWIVVVCKLNTFGHNPSKEIHRR